MGTIKRVRRNQGNQLINIVVSMTLFFGIGYIMSEYFIQANNVTMAKKIQIMQQAILEAEERVATLSIEVKQLENRDRVLDIVEQEGLEPNQDNVVAVGD